MGEYPLYSVLIPSLGKLVLAYWRFFFRRRRYAALDLSRVSGGGTLGRSNPEQERPYLAAQSGKDRAYKAGRPESRGTGRESEGRYYLGGRAAKRAGGKGSCFGRAGWEVSVRACRKRPTTPL